MPRPNPGRPPESLSQKGWKNLRPKLHKINGRIYTIRPSHKV